jgi:hypothetical protein
LLIACDEHLIRPVITPSHFAKPVPKLCLANNGNECLEWIGHAIRIVKLGRAS